MPELHRFAHGDFCHQFDATLEIVTTEAVPDIQHLQIALQGTVAFHPEVGMDGEVNLFAKGVSHAMNRVVHMTEVIEFGIEDNEAHLVGDFEYVRDAVVGTDDIHHSRQLTRE